MNILRIKIPTDKFASNTTTNDHYKNWNADLPPKSFIDPPSFAGQHLFPTQERNFETMSSLTYQPLEYSKREAFNRSENIGHLKPEGNKFNIYLF